MKKSEVIALLKANQNERGLPHWEKQPNPDGLKSFGIGLTQLRKLAKQIGRDHKLALELWDSDNHDVKIIGLLIDDPKQVTKQQAESQVEGLGVGMLTHVFSSCDATLAKTPFAFELTQQWLESDHHLRRRCAYGLLYELSKNKRNKALTDEFFLDCIKRISHEIEKEKDGMMRASMGGALIGIGKRTKVLNKATIKVATAVGPIDFNDDTGTCEPLNVLKHLTSDYIKKKLGV